MWLRPDGPRGLSQTDNPGGRHLPPPEVAESVPVLRDDWVPTAREGGGQWLATLDKLGVQHLVLDKSADFDLLMAMESRSGWLVTCEDKDAVLFSRVDAGTP